MYEQLLEHITKFELLSQFQSGFRKDHNCETAVQYLVDEWQNNFDKGTSTVIVFLDLKRAFETISRDILVKKLKYYGLR